MCGDTKRAREARRRAAAIAIARGDASRERRRACASRWTSLGVMDDTASARLRNVLYALLYRVRSRNSRYSFDAGARARERRRGQFHLFLGRESSSSWSPLSLVEEGRGRAKRPTKRRRRFTGDARRGDRRPSARRWRPYFRSRRRFRRRADACERVCERWSSRLAR